MKYRLPTIEDKKIIENYIQEHYDNNENILHASNNLTSLKYEEWVAKIESNTQIPDTQWGRSLTYLVFNENDKLIGLLNIRYELNKKMKMKYGNIGYGVRPTERRKGYATKMLQYGLKICKEKGLKNVILGCYKENIASSKTIEKNGGIKIRENQFDDIIANYYEIKLI